MQLALGVVGAVIGAPFGMSALGWSVGTALGGMIAASDQPDQYGPKLSDLKLQKSTVGEAIAVIYGRARVAGNVIDGSDLEQHEHVEDVGGGKGGGPQSHTFTYTAHVAIGICEGEIAGIGRMWQDYKLVSDGSAKTIDAIAGSSVKASAVRIYLGTEDQMPDPALQAIHGDLCPAYRGLAYIVFENLDLTASGGRVPNFEFEVFRLADKGEPRIINATTLKLEQLGPNYVGTELYERVTGSGPFGVYWDGIPHISGHDGGVVRMTALNYSSSPYNGQPPSLRNNRSFAIDYNGNFKSNEGRGGEEVLIGSRVDTSGPAPVFYQYVGLVRGDPSAAVQALTLNAASNRIINAETLGLAVFGSAIGSGNLLTYAGLGSEAGRVMAGLYVSQDGFSVYMFTAAVGGPGVDRWLKLQFTAARTLSVVEHGTCDYLGDGTNAAIPSNKISGTGSSPYNAGLAGMMESDGVHLWTCRDGPVNVFKIEEGKLSHLTTLDTGAYANDFRSIYVQNGVAFLAGQRSCAQVTRIPTLEAKTVTLGGIVGDICARCGLTPDEIDVSELTDPVNGFVIGARMPGRAAILPLQSGFFFDARESEGKLRFPKRGSAPVAVIPEDDLAAHAGDAGSENLDTVELTRMQEVELPSETVVNYFSLDGDYANGSQRGQRQTTDSLNTVGMNLAIVMSDAKAKQVAMVNNLAPWVNRNPVSFSTSRKYIHIEPCDVVTVYKDGQPLVVRIVSRTEGGDGVISFQAVMEDPEIYSQSATPGRTLATTQTLSLPSSTYLQPLDIPALTDAYADGPVLLFAADGYTDAWKGAALFASEDGGANYADTRKTFAPGAILGFAMTALPAPKTIATFDETSFVDVRLTDLADTLSSASEAAVLGGANAILIGDEVLQYKHATQIGPGQFRLSGLLRGRRGSDWASGSHKEGDRFVALSPAMLRQLNMSPAQIGKEILFKAPTAGATVASARAVSLTYKAENMRPLAPVYGFGYRDVSPADWHLRWTRRSRAGGDWLDYVDARIAETSEKYDLEIYADSAFTVLKRTFTDLTTAEATYTATQQVSDFGSAQTKLFCKVYQKSDVIGRGRSLKFTADFTAPAAPTPIPVDPGTPSPSAAKLLLHFDGANGSTAIIDSSGNGINFTSTGTVSITDTDKKIGSSSLSMTSAFLSYVGNALDAGTGDYCYEGWFKLNSVTSGHTGLFETRPPGGAAISDNRIAVGVLNGGQIYAWFNATVNAHPVSFAAGVWNHVALQRKAGVITLFLNGVGQVLATNSAHNLNGGGFMIGAITENTSDRRISGKIDEFRAIVGSAPYSGDFTPPTSPYTS